MRSSGPLPVAVPEGAGRWLAERRALLGQRLSEVADRAGRGALEGVRIDGSELTITPHKADTPEAAEVFAQRLYDMLPLLRITDLLVEVDRWTGLSAQFTHLRTGLPSGDPRV